MLNVLAGALIGFAAPQEAAQDAAQDASKELTDMVAKVAKAENYEFTVKNETEGGGFGGGRGGRGGGGGGGGAERPNEPTKGAYQKGQPMRLAVGEVVAYKDGEQLVYKEGEGEWQAFDRASFGRGGRGGAGGGRGGAGGAEGRGGRGGREGGGGGEARGGGGGGEGRGAGRGGFGGSSRALFTLSAAQAPHDMLKDFAKKVTGVKKMEKDGKVIFSGKLTKEGAEGLSAGGRGGFGGRGGRGGGGGGGGPQMETSGTFSIEMKDKAIQSVVFSVTRSGSFGERSFEMTTKNTFGFAKVGKTKYEVPADALAKFEL